MNDADTAASPSRRRPWRRWLKRGLVAAGLGLLVLVVFHRPLAHWVIREAGRKYAAKAGIEGSWSTSGSLWGDFALSDVRLAGGAQSVVRSLTLEHASAGYSLRRLRRDGPGAMVDRVAVRRLEADIDLTRRTAAREGAARPRKAKGGKWPSVRIPAIEIDHVSLRLRLPGGIVEVVDFSLHLDPAKPGHLSVARFAAPGVPELVDARGSTRATTDSLAVESLGLWPDVALERLVVRLADLALGRVSVEVAAHQSLASLEAEGVVNMLAADGIEVDAKGRTRSVSHATLEFWGIADGGMAWNSGEVDVTASGPVLRPDRLRAQVQAKDAVVSRSGLPTVAVDFAAALGDAAITVTRGQLAAGLTTAAFHGSAAAPQRWMDIAASRGEVAVEMETVALEEWLPARSAVQGHVVARADAGFAARALTEIRATATGSSMMIHGLPVQQLTANATTPDGKQFRAQAEAQLNEDNSLRAEGGFDLRDDQAFEVSWQAACRDLATVPVEARGELPWPTAGTIESAGALSGLLKPVREGDWSRLRGQATLDAAGIVMREAPLESLRLRAAVDDGVANVQEFAAHFDAQNNVTGAATIALGERLAATAARVSARFPAIDRLSAWSTAFGGPALRGGMLQLNWELATGAPGGEIAGTASVLARDLRIADAREPLGVEATVTHNGASVLVPSFMAEAGPWRADGSVSWQDGRLEMPALNAWMNGQHVAEAKASIPLRRAAREVSDESDESDKSDRSDKSDTLLDLDAPVLITVRTEPLDIARAAAVLGHDFPVRGVVTANADISGSVRTLAGTVRVEAAGLRPAGKAGDKLAPATVSVTAELKDGRLTLDGRIVQSPLEPATLEARMPFDAAALLRDPSTLRTTALSGRLRLPRSSLAFVPGWVPALESVKGTAEIDATVSGTAGQPEWTAVVGVVVPEARLKGASLPSIRELVLRIEADQKRVRVREAGVMLAGGRLRVEGGADLSRAGDPVLDLRLLADEVLVVRDDNLSLRANANVLCRGPIARAAVSGNIDLVRGRVFKEIEFLPLSLPNQLPPPPPATALARQGPPALPAPFDAWTFDVGIRTRDPVRLMGNVARGNVVADLKLTGSGARPVLTGRATMEQMWVKLPFSRLNITNGSIEFTEDKPFDPQINVVGESVTDGRMVQVIVQGRALDPMVRLTSSPPLPEGEIASLLATGVTTSDLSTRGGEAAGRAAFVVLQQAYRRMFPRSARRSDDDEPPRLSFEFAFFGSDPSRRSLSAVYELNPQWRIIGRVGEAGTFRGLLHYLIRFR